MKTIILLVLFFLGCGKSEGLNITTTEQAQERDYRTDMRNFVIKISEYAKAKNQDFAIIPQNGMELVTDNGYSSGNPMTLYLNAIDGNGQENLFYGYEGDNKPTPENTSKYLISLLQVSQKEGNTIFVIDYCSTKDRIKDSYEKNSTLGFVSFVATERNLTVIPDIPTEVSKVDGSIIDNLKEAKNFLFFLNYENYANKEDLLNDLVETSYDVIFIDLFFSDGSLFSKEDIRGLKTKPDGASRKIICYMSIGEAEDYRFYWKNNWNSDPPFWLEEENVNWPGNFKVRYWEEDWQRIIMGGPDAYLDKVIEVGFDGVYMDIIDAFEYFENK